MWDLHTSESNMGNCYTSQLKYVFRLEENVSRVVGQDSLTPRSEQNSLTT